MNKFLQEGDMFELKNGMEAYVDADPDCGYNHACVKVGKDFKYKEGIKDKNVIIYKTNHLVGKYMVVRTAKMGGGRQLEMTGHYSEYPNGHRVFATKIDNPKIKVSFYQSGCFTAVNENVPILKIARG